MCKYCNSCFVDPKSDDRAPTLIGEDTVKTDKGYLLKRISVHLGYTWNLKNTNKYISRIEVNLHDANGEDLAHVDIPVKYCPFCGEKLPEPITV